MSPSALEKAGIPVVAWENGVSCPKFRAKAAKKYIPLHLIGKKGPPWFLTSSGLEFD
jgi:hypothetical protein